MVILVKSSFRQSQIIPQKNLSEACSFYTILAMTTTLQWKKQLLTQYGCRNHERLVRIKTCHYDVRSNFTSMYQIVLILQLGKGVTDLRITEKWTGKFRSHGHLQLFIDYHLADNTVHNVRRQFEHFCQAGHTTKRLVLH